MIIFNGWGVYLLDKFLLDVFYMLGIILGIGIK